MVAEAVVSKSTAACRLCNGETRYLFSRKVLGKYTVGYLECTDCGSLQSESPYWLAEAYQTSLASLDTGAAQRCLTNWGLTFFVAKLFSSRSLIDWGGGDGLLCRLLRDVGLDCRLYDAHATPTYGQSCIDGDDAAPPDLVTAFEVVEHLTRPASELQAIFRVPAPVVLLSTATYRGQGKDWWYLVPETGQHIFFYSEKALMRIARNNQLRLWFAGDYVLFVPAHKVTWRARVLLFVFFRARAMKFWRLVVTSMPTPGVWADFVKMKSKYVD